MILWLAEENCFDTLFEGRTVSGQSLEENGVEEEKFRIFEQGHRGGNADIHVIVCGDSWKYPLKVQLLKSRFLLNF